MRWNSRRNAHPPGFRAGDLLTKHRPSRGPRVLFRALVDRTLIFIFLFCIFIHSGLLLFVWEIACSAWLAWLACHGTGSFPSRATMLP